MNKNNDCKRKRNYFKINIYSINLNPKPFEINPERKMNLKKMRTCCLKKKIKKSYFLVNKIQNDETNLLDTFSTVKFEINFNFRIYFKMLYY